MAIESHADVNFFIGIQQDANKIAVVVTDIFCTYKIKTVAQLLQKLKQIETNDDFFEISNVFENVVFESDNSKFSGILEYKRLENLLKNIENCIGDKNMYETKILDLVKKRISALNDYSKNIKFDYLSATGLLKSICTDVGENKIDHNVIQAMKFRAQIILDDIVPKIEPRSLKEIIKLVNTFLLSVLPRVQDENVTSKLRAYVSEIFFIIEHDSRDMPYIKELREKLDQRYFFSFHRQQTSNSENCNQLDDKLEVKVNELKNILQDQHKSLNMQSYKSSKHFQAAVEILVLDIMTIYGGSGLYLNNNVLFLDFNSPLLNGKYLRNHLAHDNALVNLMLCDPTLAIFLNAGKLVQEDITTSKKKLGKSISLDLSKLKEKYDNNVTVMSNQEKMFLALENGDLRSFENCIKTGADIFGRDAKLWTALHYAAKSPNLKIMKFVKNVDCNARDAKGRTPLYIASMCGNNNVIEYLITRAKVDVTLSDNMGKTALHAAAQYGHLQAVKILLKNGSSTSARDIAGLIPLFYATRNDHVKVVEILLEKDVNYYEFMGGFSLLHVAVENGNSKTAQFLLGKNANVNARDESNWTPLHAASRDGYLDMVKLLISKGADVNESGTNGCSALFYATENSHEKIIALLIKNGAKVNVCHHSSRLTPLHVACREGHVKIVRNLLANKASLTASTSANQTPLDYAIHSGHSEIVKILLNYAATNVPSYAPDYGPLLFLAAEAGFEDVVKILLQNGAIDRINVSNSFGITPLQQALLKKHKNIVELLLNSSASVKTRDKNGNTPLHAAADCGWEDVIRSLVSKGANVEEKNNEGQTPLLIAAFLGNEIAVKTLIEQGASPSNTAPNGSSALHAAVMGGKENIVKFLLQKGVDINGRGIENATPLHLAIDGGLEDIAKLLITHGASLTARISCGATPLMLAIKNSRIDIIKILIAKGCDINANGGVPLFGAIRYGFSEIVELFLSHKASLDIVSPDRLKNSPMHFAVAQRQAKIVSLLIKAGASVDRKNVYQETALHLAAELGYFELVKLLVEAKATVDVKSVEGLTPLHKAAAQGHVKIVKFLLNRVKNINEKDYSNRTALEYAVTFGHCKIVELILKNNLPEKKININDKDNDNFTLLHIACQQKNTDVVKCLIDYGADIYSENNAGTKPIHIAAREGSKDIVEYLLGKGQDVNDKATSSKLTALHYAVMGHTEVVSFLISKNADLNAKDKSDMTPLHLAASYGQLEIVKLLLNHGAICNPLNIESKKPSEKTQDVSVRKILTATEELFDAIKENDDARFSNCINSGAILTARNHQNLSLVHYAAWKGYHEIVRLILQNKVNPNILGDKNYTPLHYAAKFSHANIVKLLLSYGAVFDATSETSKTALDFSSDEETQTLLKTITSFFTRVQKNDTKVLNDIKNIKDDKTLKAIYNCKNKKLQTLVTVAMTSKFSKMNELNKIIMGGADQLKEAETLLSQQNFDESLKMLEKACESRKKLLGPDNPALLEIKRLKGRVMFAKGLYNVALKIFEDTSSEEEKILGPDHENTLQSKSLFAFTLHKLGKNSEALTIFRQVYQKQVEVLGRDHEDSLMTNFHMALVLTDLKMFDEALAANKEIYDIRKKLLTEVHPLTVMTLNNVGLVLSRKKEYEEALTIFKDVLEKKKKIFGADDCSSLNTLENIAAIYSDMGNHAESSKSLQHIVDIKKRKLGSNHPETLLSIFNLANEHFSQNKYISALKIYSEIDDRMKMALGSSHSMVIKLEENMKTINDIYKINGRNLKEDLCNLKIDLFTSASEGKLDKLEEFLKHGFDVNTEDEEGRTPLHFSVSNQQIEATKLLLSHQADVTRVTKKGNTVLHTAALSGNQKLLEILLRPPSRDKLHDKINAETHLNKTTPLHVAAEKGHFCIVVCLLKHGAAYDVVNKQNQKPVEVSSDQKVKNLLELIEDLFTDVKKMDPKALERLKTVGQSELDAVINSRNKKGLTLLQETVLLKNKSFSKTVSNIIKERRCMK